MLCASSGTDGARGGARGDRARQDDRARQQGSARHGRRHRHRGRARGTASRSCRSTASTTRSTSACTAARRAEVAAARSSPRRADRSAAARRPSWQSVTRGRRAAASDLADGPEDHDRLGDADEQGARGDRGALAVRRPRRSDRRRRSIRSRSCTRWSSSIDGSIIAQLGVTDMRLPIQYAFSYPERWPARLPSLDLARAGRLEFEAPDRARFRASPRVSRARRGAQPAGRAERRQRGRGGAVSRGPPRLPMIPDVIERTMDTPPAGRGVHARGRACRSSCAAREYTREIARGVASLVFYKKSE